jgi:hypothetical protein
MDLEDKNKDINIEMTTATDDKRFVRDCCIDKEAFDEYLADKITTEMKDRMNKYMEGNEEEPMECLRFGLENPTDRNKLEYSVCMLVDCDGGYMPIFNTGINTSSYFAMWSCGIDRDYDDEDEIPKMTINEIAELCCEEYRGMFIKMCEQIEKKSYKIEKKVEAEPESKNTDTTIKMTEANITQSAMEEAKALGVSVVQTTSPKTRAERNNNIGVGATGGGSMEIKEELPLFMREGGEAEIERRRKELETYLKLLNKNPEQMLRNHTFVALNPATLNPEQVGEQQVKDIKEWFAKPQTKMEIWEWLHCGKHKADGKSWNCGFMGSRWADKKINGRPVRFAFYADKDQKPEHLKHLAYSIVLDPSY